jgi:hypothetical protein
MHKPLFAFLFLVLRFFRQRRDHKTAFLTFQLRMLKARLDTKYIIPNPEERKQLIALGGKLDHEIDDCLEVVTPDTYARWLRDQAKGKSLLFNST